MGSQPGGGHETPFVDWIAVFLMLFGAIALGLALPLRSWWAAIIGLVLGVVGLGLALGYGIMNHTEDYDVQPKADDRGTDRPASPQAHRIISA